MLDSFRRLKKIILRLKGLAAVGTANVIGTAILSVFWLFVASLLGTEGYGEVSYFIAIANIASVIAFLGAGKTLTVYIAKQVKIQAPIFLISITSSLVISIVLFVILSRVEISLYVIGYVIFGLVTHDLLGLKLYKNYSKYLITQRILMVVLALAFFYLIGLQGIILGYAIAFFPYSFTLYKRFKEAKIDFSVVKSRLGFMMNIYGQDLSKILSRSIDKLIIFPIFGFAILGNYQLGFQVLMVLSILPLIVFQYVLPREAIGYSNKKLKVVTVVFSVILAILASLLSPVIFPILFPEFTEAVKIIQIMSFAIIPITVSFMYNSKFLAREKSRYVIIGSMIFLSIQISGIIILGEIYGIIGIAFSTVLGAISEAAFLTGINHLKKDDYEFGTKKGSFV